MVAKLQSMIRKNSCRISRPGRSDRARAAGPTRLPGRRDSIVRRGAVAFRSAQHFGANTVSIDFRTVHLDDVRVKIGAQNVDTAATGTSLRDFLHATDFSRMPTEIAELYDTEPVRRRIDI